MIETASIRRPILSPATLLASALLVSACGGGTPETSAVNPPAAGFDLAGSDPRAIEIADATMAAMGGREAWDRTRFIAWNFFGRRYHVWDRHTEEIRVEAFSRTGEGPVIIRMNLRTGEGRAWEGGEPVTDETRLTELLQLGREAWINDGYWLFMPYKLKDTGVTLKYLGERPMQDGRTADLLELTFRDVGVTPNNKYRVYVAKDSGLVEQWDFFGDRTDPEPQFTTPWHDWQPHGGILLSASRGERGISQIAVFDEVPAGLMDNPQPQGLPAPGES